MATCKDCRFYGVCIMNRRQADADAACCKVYEAGMAFEKRDIVEVVRCKDCKHWIHMEDGFGDCTNGRFHLDGHADPTMEADDFCSCGERRNNGKS